MSKLSIFGRGLLPLLLLAPLGCGDATIQVDKLPRKAVTGSVTIDGQPLAVGQIQFEPVKGAQGETAIAVGEIVDGKYAIDSKAGPVPGNYKIKISSRPLVKITPGDGPGPVTKPDPEQIPAQYNTATTLEKEVKNESVNTFDFDLKK